MKASILSLLTLVAAACLAAGGRAADNPRTKEPNWLPATPEKLPRWRGFNLLEKFYLRPERKPFVEEDFRLIAKLGFNFVRLPMDYRLWIKDGDWERFDEDTLEEIDQAVEWGRQYGIHVCLNFHRAPGYTVARPPEKSSLWTDAETQRVCAMHWAHFARRYRGIPSERLSFNLMNEPAGVAPENYVAVARRLAAAIRAEDPDRLIISDGLEWGRLPIPELRALRIAQATRGYTPMEISHYQASWTNGDRYPEPQWPRPEAPNGTLLSPAKSEGSHPLVIDGPFAKETTLRMRVLVVSSTAKLMVEADGIPIFDKSFRCGPGQGEWKEARFIAKYNIYQNLFDRDYLATIPAGTRQIRIRVASGDWLQIGGLGFRPADAKDEDGLTLIQEFGRQPDPFRYAPGSENPFPGMPTRDREWLWQNNIEPWLQVQRSGVGVIVGEWGCYNKTPHDIVLRWAEDNLANWKRAGWGWALWIFRGSFGLLDSGRSDVHYEDFEGRQLDRKLLDLLQRF